MGIPSDRKSLVSLVDLHDLSCTSLSTIISKKHTGEHVATTTWRCKSLYDDEAESLFIHSEKQSRPGNAVLHTFCPSSKLIGERNLERTFLPRVHPEKCRPVDLLEYERLRSQYNPRNGNDVLNEHVGEHISPPVHLSSVPDETAAFEASQTPIISDHVIPITRTFGSTRRGRKRKRAELKRSEAELLSNAIEDHVDNLQHISSPHEDSPLRVIHFVADNRCFAYASAYCAHIIQNSLKCFPVISVIWQTNQRPMRAVAISFSVHPSSDGIRSICTCQPLRSTATGETSSCEHIQICMMNEEFVKKIESALRAQINSVIRHRSSTEIFGTPVPTTSTSLNISFPSVCLNRSSLQSYERMNDIQRKNNLEQKWAFWLVFDSQSFSFVPLLKLQRKPFLCFACRLESGSRGMCNHELSCFKFQKGVNSGSPEDDAVDTESIQDNEERSPTISPDESFGENHVSGYLGRSLYVTNTIPRSLLQCHGEVKITEQIAGLIEGLEPNSALYMHDSTLASCKKCGQLNTSMPQWHLRRNMNLFTLSQGTVRLVVCDWICQHCEDKNYFSGTYHSVFTARKESCYTTELMYTWAQLVCYQGFSFREAYRTTRLTSGATSNTSRFRKNGSHNHDKENEPSRNRANEAFREFLKTMKTNCPSFTKLTFSCSRCEVPLTADDCAQLNIDQQLAADLELKRFRAIVIDGTAAGVLAQLPKYNRSFTTLKSVRVLHSKIIPTAVHQKALQNLLSMCSESIRTIRKRRRRLLQFSQNTICQFWLCNPLETPRDVVTPKTIMTLAQAQLAMAMCEENPCFCGTRTETHSETCDSLHSELKRPNELVMEILGNLFKVSCESPSSQEQQQENRGEENPAGQHPDGEQEEILDLVSPNQSTQADNQHASERRNIPDAGEEVNTEENAQRNNQHVSERHSVDNDGQDTSSSSTTQRSEKSIRARLLVTDIDKHAELVEALLALLKFITLEQVGMPYVTRISHDLTGMDAVPVPPLNNGQDLPSMTSSSVNLHKKVVQSLMQYSRCNRHGEQISYVPWEDCSCVAEIKKWAPLLQDGNPLLETFCIQLTKLRQHRNGSLEFQIKAVLDSLCRLMDLHLAMAVTYLRKLQRKMSTESKEFWKKCDFKEAVTRDNEIDDEFKWYETGMCFPGRFCCRPGISFDVKESQHCNKKYPRSETHSAGLLTVQCACENPKLIGFIVMTRAESTALALSAILMYFPLPPRTVYYDNACNLFASIMLRLPWLLNCTRVAVDRFHYKSHTCSAFFCPDSYQVLDQERTETAESFNARIDKSLYHMRHLGADNLIPFLYNRLGQLNVAALFKEKYHRQDLENEDLSSFLRSRYKCICQICTSDTLQIGEAVGASTLAAIIGNTEQDIKQGHDDDRNHEEAAWQAESAAQENFAAQDTAQQEQKDKKERNTQESTADLENGSEDNQKDVDIDDNGQPLTPFDFSSSNASDKETAYDSA